MSSIAGQFRFRSWRTVYDDPANAGLRAARPDPNVLFPGDQVVIPDRQARAEEADTGKRHRFFTRTSTTFVRVKIEYGRDFDYELVIDDAVMQKGTSDGKSPIVQEIAAGARAGTMTIWPADLAEPKTKDNGFTWNLELGFLSPIEKVSGVKGRLANLGFYFGPVDEREDADTSAAIIAFERSLRRRPIGRITDELRSALVKAHDDA